MATTHVPVTNYYDVYDLWAAGLLYAHGVLCVFPPHMDTSAKGRERTIASWGIQRARTDMYTYRTED